MSGGRRVSAPRRLRRGPAGVRPCRSGHLNESGCRTRPARCTLALGIALALLEHEERPFFLPESKL
jgi:hypothetical protein